MKIVIIFMIMFIVNMINADDFRVKINQSLDVMTKQQLNIVNMASKLIERNEGFCSRVYLCPAGKKTIGYGFTDKSSISKKEMTREEAGIILATKILSIDYKLKEVGIDLPYDRQSVIIDFIYNVGWTNFKTSALYKKLQAKNYEAVPTELKKWVYCHMKGKPVILKGLVKRRELGCQVWQHSPNN